MFQLVSSPFVVSSSHVNTWILIFANHHVFASIQAFSILLSQPVVICDSRAVLFATCDKSKSVFNAFIILGVGRYVFQAFTYTQLYVPFICG